MYLLLRNGRSLLAAAVAVLFSMQVFAQSLLLDSPVDPNLPVTNKMNFYTFYGPGIIGSYMGASITSIASANARYYLLGNFTNLAKNTGPSAILDTNSHTLLSNKKWFINGMVNTSAPDGNGGFYIGGAFTKIGDSTRNYIAHIDQNGAPLPWPLTVDNYVTTLIRKNDTLFIGGAFYTVSGATKPRFAMYSLNADSLYTPGGYGPFVFMDHINAMLIRNDTVIYGGEAGSQEAGIRKYNFKDQVFSPWTANIPWETYYSLQFNQDSSAIVCGAYYNGHHILGVDNITGNIRYSIDLSPYGITNAQVKAIGNKVYVAGRADNYNSASHPGLLTFNANTGATITDNIPVNGYISFLDIQAGNIYISGKFTSVQGTARENFAVLDAATYTLKDWQLTPTDAITTLAFSGPNTLATGYFNGINAAHRDGFAIIDSATGEIYPSPSIKAGLSEGKRMMVRGDSLFVLGISGRPNSCMFGSYTPVFAIYRISTGEALFGSFPMDDFTIDGEYLYGSYDHQLRRFHLPDMTKDISWGFDWNRAGGDHTPTWLIVSGDKIYGLGDNRFIEQCTTLTERTGYLMVYDKATGNPYQFYSYKGQNPTYDQINFDHGLMVGNKLYIQGHFSSLNGKNRHNFACLDLTNGNILDWQTPFTQNLTSNYLDITTPLKLYDGKIWFGCYGNFQLPNGRTFGGFGAIDTATGNLLNSNITLLTNRDGYAYDYTKADGATDFLIGQNGLTLTGGFDWVNQIAQTSLARFKISTSSASLSLCETTQDNLPADLSGATYQWQINRGQGQGFVNLPNDTHFTGANTATLRLNQIPYAYDASQLRCLADNQSGKIYDLLVTQKIDPSVTITASATMICKGNPATFTANITNGGTTPQYTWLVNNTTVNAADSFFTTTTLSNRDSIKVILQSNAYCRSADKDTSSAAVMIVYPVYTPSVTILGDSLRSICQDDKLTFTSNAVNGGSYPSYQWYKNGIPTDGYQNSYATSNLGNGDSITLMMTSNQTCAIPATVTSNAIKISVRQKITPVISIQGDTVAYTGTVIPIKATSLDTGNDPLYQWQDSTQSYTWTDIAGANDSSINYTALLNPTKIRCILTSQESCVTQTATTSNTLSVRVIANNSAAAIHVNAYPNPATDRYTIDGLQATDNWTSLIILSMDGHQELGPISLAGLDKIVLNISTLPAGVHFVTMYKKDQSKIYLRLLKL